MTPTSKLNPQFVKLTAHIWIEAWLTTDLREPFLVAAWNIRIFPDWNLAGGIGAVWALASNNASGRAEFLRMTASRHTRT